MMWWQGGILVGAALGMLTGGTLLYLRRRAGRPIVWAEPLNLEELHEELGKRGGVAFKLRRRITRRALEIAVRCWPETPQIEGFRFSDAKIGLVNQVRAEYKQQVGFMSTSLLKVIALVVMFLLEWWLERPEARHRVILDIKRQL